MSRGLRNNNPLNIRISSSPYKGKIEGSDKAFETFESMPYGYRAAFVILGTYLSNGFNTIEKIVSRWAPPEDNNDTAAYITAVEKQSGVPRDKVLNAYSGNEYIRIVSAMSAVENGVKANMNDVIAGFGLQSKLKR